MLIPLYPELGSLPLDEYLALLWPDRPQRAIQDLFARGRIREKGKPAARGRLVADLRELELRGELAEVPTMYLGEEGETPELEILHEDARLCVVAKPSGLPVVPDREQRLPSVLGCLVRRELAARQDKKPQELVRWRIVHRIDRLTSGLVLVAKTPDVERRLGAAFEGREVKKEYRAILTGVVSPARITVHAPIVPGRKGRMRAEIPGPAAGEWPQDAVTELEVLERFAAHTHVRARPETGRTHQIRVHAWAAGWPLAIDPLYGPRTPVPVPGLDRLSLHAYRYELPPDLGEPHAFECPLPADLELALANLRKPSAPA